jgi:NADH-quinone oxidoreductase subunit J
VIAEQLLFAFLAACAVTTAVLMVFQRNPVTSAISLIGNFFCLAALYLLLNAQLLAVLQIAVYAGAIMVLVVFVIMLLNIGDELGLSFKPNLRMIAGGVVMAAFLLELLYLFILAPGAGAHAVASPRSAEIGTVESMGHALYSGFLFPLQITGLLLLIAVVGAVVLAKRRQS